MSGLLSSLPLWAALPPLGCYLVFVGWLNLRRRPTTLGGAFDVLLVALAVSGLVAAGPLALLQPAGVSPEWTAVLLALAFVLAVAGGLLASRPRAVVYNVTLDQLRPVVAEIVTALDPSVRWAGETAALPARRLQVHLDGRGAGRTVSVVSLGSRPSPEAWTEFVRRLQDGASRLRVRGNPWGILPASLGVGLLAAAAWLAARATP